MCGPGEKALSGSGYVVSPVTSGNRRITLLVPLKDEETPAIEGDVPLGWRIKSDGGPGDTTFLTVVCAR